ncbi:unnamed protein product [Brassica oleracea var. botrytis]
MHNLTNIKAAKRNRGGSRKAPRNSFLALEVRRNKEVYKASQEFCKP